MNKGPNELWSEIISDISPEGILYTAMRHVAHILKDMLARPIKVNSVRAEMVSISELRNYVANSETDMIGVYLCIDDNLPGQTLLTLTLDDAMYLADWLLEARPGTTTKLGPLEYSALAETGNVVLSSFLNALTHFTRVPLHLSPPVVSVDELPSLLEAAAGLVTTTINEVLIIKTDFVNVESSLLIQFWVLPDPATLSLDWAGIK